jgi:hypothetical protein
MVQTTFTRQKRALAKASAWIEKLRAQEVRTITYSPKMEKIEEVRNTYVDYLPEEITENVLDIIVEVVKQHGARQQANSHNTGHFNWQGIAADLTVPQLRALQNVYAVLTELVHKLPRRNPKIVPNMTVDEHPAFAHKKEKHEETKVRYVPYEEDSTTRVRTYEEKYKEITHFSQVIEIDYGLDIRLINRLGEMVTDLGTAIQSAIDEANAKGHESDPLIEGVINDIREVFVKSLPKENRDKSDSVQV